MGYNQLALVPRRNFSNVAPTQIQGEVRQPQLSGWTYYQPEASTSTFPKRAPVKIRLPREADRSRLAKDILKQLGKPSGLVPAVPTRHEYEERRKAVMEATSAQRPPQPAVTQPQLDEAPLPSEVVPVSDQVTPSSLYVNHPPATPASEPPSLEYPDPDPDSAPHDADAANQDIHMDIQPHEDSLVPQPPASPRPNPPQDSISSPIAPESVLGAEERSAVEHRPPTAFPSSERRGPPPDTEIIEISDDEEGPVVDTVTATFEPMEVDEGTGTGGAISQSLSELSLGGEGAPVVVETETEPLGRRSSEELIASEDIQFTGRNFPKNRVSIELPPLPDYARRSKGKERAPVQEEDEEGMYRASAWWI